MDTQHNIGARRRRLLLLLLRQIGRTSEATIKNYAAPPVEVRRCVERRRRRRIVMCWFFYILRMLFTKFERIYDNASFIQAFSLNNGKREESDEEEKLPPIKGPSPFDILPDELIGNVASRLSFNDIVSFRQVSQRMNNVYKRHRNEITGPEIHVFVSIEDGQVVTSFRGHKQLRGIAKLIPPSNRNMVFRNSDVTLTLRFGENRITSETAMEILKMFRKSKIERIQLRASLVSVETKDLINNLNCSNVELNIGRYTSTVSEVLNIRDLQVREHLLFFQLDAIFGLKIRSLSVRVTAASMPNILKCINEWKENRRDILSWFFKMPVMEVPRAWDDLQIDWRRAIAERYDKSARLRVNSRIEPVEVGELIQYQTVSWFLY
uniref:F-box domain-containing protein n=2 Tax=Caenorhabditis tropicalis TaxID=1561998 RepID=A0A1I7T647_9PELO